MDQTFAQEELAFIRKVMADSRTVIYDDGKPGIVWGLIVALGMFATYIDATTDLHFNAAWLWIGLSVLGWAYIYYYKAKKIKKYRMRTFAGKLIGAIWGACGMCIGLTIVMTYVAPEISGEWMIHPLALTTICSILVGMAYYISGIVYGKAWVRNISYGWWIGAIAMLFWPSIHVLLIYAGMLIAFQVIPGIIMYRESRNAPASAEVV
ncbi:MAG TPA: hypothetical protein VFO76_13845 [Candidatus Kapabacteria bacterium]|nr:hypothetical protein [Candidatus Kapabacteria bacterium]